MNRGRRSNPMLLAVCAALLLAACEDQGTRSPAVVTFACPRDMPGCMRMRQDGNCLSAFAFVVRADGTRTRIPLQQEGALSIDAGVAAVRSEEAGFYFDINLDQWVAGAGEEVTLEFRLYPGPGSPVTLGATLEGVRADLLGSEPLNVRLYPIGQWAEAYDTAADGIYHPVARAFHRAVPLPNGDVLFIGGVAGRRGDPPEPARINVVMGQTAPLVYDIDLYDHSQHRFVRLERGDTAGFGRVLFETRYLGREGDRHRIRIFGGVTAEPNQPALAFGARGTEHPTGTPVYPAAAAMRADPVDLLIDVSTDVPTLAAIVAAPDAEEPRGVLAAVSQPQAVVDESPDVNDASAVVFPQLIEVGAYQPGTQAYMIDARGNPIGDPTMVYDLEHPRVGATVTPLVTGTTLVWGGNVSTGVEDPVASAAEIHASGMATTPPIDATATPTAFHRAAPAGANLVLTVGGFLIQPQGPLGPTAAFTDIPPNPIRVLEVAAVGGVTVRANLGAGGYVSSIFHTLTDLGDGRFLVAGGGTVSGDGFSRFVASDQAGIITPSLGGYEPLDGPLTDARLGHSATLLPGHRVLVHGGFSGNTGQILNETSVPSPEVLYLVDIDPTDRVVAGQCEPIPALPDAGPGMDAALPPRTDAGGVDSGPGDAGGLPDAGPDPDAGMGVDGG